ncbi:DUF5819 family protein [Thermoactinomyces sp. DSM 45892]|uniref:DUF5819 family protein n=1 Tax=Thermoactinomyces sp. DSM 45892 TaxID=1882753 RepID=UPI00089B158B|nr:DUF5819 family protein [Thermoactinomyces sp. DSM 45892]SDY46103.1 hypothetical protein SAMN05444416_1058 [Thermoactinomyces sp. DSM 45892]
MWKKILSLGFLGAFVVHFALTALYVSPSNPLKVKYSQVVNGYMEPLFTQNWKLFAPDPVTSDNTFYVRVKIKETDGQEKITGWFDITSDLFKKNQENRFTPYNRLLRFPRSSIALIGEQDDILATLKKKVQDKKVDEEKFKDLLEGEKIKQKKTYATKLVNRYAESYLASVFPGKKIEQLQVMMVETESTPFSKRADKSYQNKKSSYEFDWKDYQPGVPLL